MLWIRVPPEQLFFSLKRELLGLVVLPCFDFVGLTVSMHTSTDIKVQKCKSAHSVQSTYIKCAGAHTKRAAALPCLPAW